MCWGMYIHSVWPVGVCVCVCSGVQYLYCRLWESCCMWWRWYYDIIIGVHTCTAVLGAQLAWVTSFVSEHDRGTHYSYSYSQWSV